MSQVRLVHVHQHRKLTYFRREESGFLHEKSTTVGRRDVRQEEIYGGLKTAGYRFQVPCRDIDTTAALSV